jgi:hypothetical protein
MRLDHISYVASHDQISDVVNRIGSQIGTAFVDGGIHPKFGTRNFTAPLLNGQYIEVVCPLDHPATDATPFGRAVKKKLLNGGGWMAWVVATSSIDTLEKQLGRQAVYGERKKPNGSLLQWKQIGILEILEDPSQPFYIEWISNEHPSMDGSVHAKLTEIVILGTAQPNLIFLEDLQDRFINYRSPQDDSTEFLSRGIKEVVFEFNGKLITID